MNLCFVKPKRTLSYTASALVLTTSFLAHDSALAMRNGEDDPKPQVNNQKRPITDEKGKEKVKIRRVNSAPFHEEGTLDQGSSKETKRALIRDGKRPADDSADNGRTKHKKARQTEELSLSQTGPYTPAELYKMVEENPEGVRSDPALQEQIVNALYDGKLILSPKQFESIFTEIDIRAYVDAKWAITLVTYCKDKETFPDDFMDIIRSQAENIIDFHVVIGKIYQSGRHVEKSDEDAAKWFLGAAKQGNSDAQNNLGRMYYAGRGVEKSYLDALNWFLEAAKQGHSEAQNNLGRMYYDGRGIEKSYPDALNWFHAAAKQGHHRAQRNLGFMYNAGFGIERSDQKAVKWCLKATEKGCIETCSILRAYFARTHARGGEDSPFHLTKNERRKIQTFIGVLQYFAGHFNPREGFAEGRSIPFLYKYLNKAANDLIQYEDLVSYLNKPGFLVTGICPTFDIYTAGKEPRSVFPVYIGHDLYLCVGEENVKAGVQLQKLLLRMQNPQRFEASLAILEAIADSDDEDTRESIRQLTDAKDFFIELQGKMSEHIVNNANGRARLFEERVLGLSDFPVRDFFLRARVNFTDSFLRADMGTQY